MRHSCSFALAFFGLFLAGTPPQAAVAVVGCDEPATIEQPSIESLPKVSRNLFYFLVGNEAGDAKLPLDVVRDGLAAVASAAPSSTRDQRLCPEVVEALERVQTALRCAQLLEPGLVYNRLSPIRPNALKDCRLPDPPRVDLTTVLEDARANAGDIRPLSFNHVAPVDFTHDEIQPTATEIQQPVDQRVAHLAEWLAMAAMQAIDRDEGDVIELHISFDAILAAPTHFCLDRFTHDYDADLDALVDRVVEIARAPLREYGRARLNFREKSA